MYYRIGGSQLSMYCDGLFLRVLVVSLTTIYANHLDGTMHPLPPYYHMLSYFVTVESGTLLQNPARTEATNSGGTSIVVAASGASTYLSSKSKSSSHMETC